MEHYGYLSTSVPAPCVLLETQGHRLSQGPYFLSPDTGMGLEGGLAAALALGWYPEQSRASLKYA